MQVNNADDDNDSAYKSDDSNKVLEIRDTVQLQSELVAWNSENKKMCTLYFYYTSGSDRVCVLCIIRLVDIFESAFVVRKHLTAIYNAIDDAYCSECRFPLFQVFPPICTCRRTLKRLYQH